MALIQKKIKFKNTLRRKKTYKNDFFSIKLIPMTDFDSH